MAQSTRTVFIRVLVSERGDF